MKLVHRILRRPIMCGMNVEESKAAATAVYNGKAYYFCSAGCKATFEKAPAKYVKS